MNARSYFLGEEKSGRDCEPTPESARRALERLPTGDGYGAALIGTADELKAIGAYESHCGLLADLPGFGLVACKVEAA